MKKLKRRKPRRRKQVVPTQPNDIPYSKYRIEWVDALSDSGWADDREFIKMKLAKPHTLLFMGIHDNNMTSTADILRGFSKFIKEEKDKKNKDIFVYKENNEKS